MSEITTHPEAARFAADLAAGIEQDWQQFEQLAQLPSLQEYCAFQSRYEDTWEDHNQPNECPFDFDPSADSYSPQETARFLVEAYDRIDAYLQAIVSGYCQQKRCEMPMADDVEQIGYILSQVFKSGAEKIMKHLKAADLTEADNGAHVSSTLLLLAARLVSLQYYAQVKPGVLEADLPQAEINEIIDERMQEACEIIRSDKRHELTKDASDIERMFAGCMNATRTFYFKGRDKGFQSWLFYMHGPAAFIPSTTKLDPADYINDAAYFTALRREEYEDFATVNNKVLGTDYRYPGPQAINKLYERAERFDQRPSSSQTLARDHANVYLGLAIHSTRHFVDAIANGQLKYSEIVHAMMQLRKQPLEALQIEYIEVPDEELDWEVLPVGMLDDERSELEPPPDLGIRKPEDEPEVEWERIASLKRYIKQWGDGYIARASPKIKGLSEDRKYYVAVLPQTLPDGRVVEHAIADHPVQGNGLYMWRAERAELRDTRDKNANLTWRRVFSHKRVIARLLGAKRFYHTKNLEYNVLDYLTCPPDQLAAHRYAVGKGAVRIARLALPPAE